MLNYQFESMEPIMVKGKEKPVKLYFPTADKVEQEIQASLNSSGILGLGLVSSALSSPIPSPGSCEPVRGTTPLPSSRSTPAFRV